MDKLRIKMVGKRDGNGKKYFFTTCDVPVLVDLSDSVIHFFLDKNQEGGELVIRHFDHKEGSEDEASSK